MCYSYAHANSYHWYTNWNVRHCRASKLWVVLIYENSPTYCCNVFHCMRSHTHTHTHKHTSKHARTHTHTHPHNHAGTLPWRGQSRAADEEALQQPPHPPHPTSCVTHQPSAQAEVGGTSGGAAGGGGGGGYREVVGGIKQQCVAFPAMLVPTCTYPGGWR